MGRWTRATRYNKHKGPPKPAGTDRRQSTSSTVTVSADIPPQQASAVRRLRRAALSLTISLTSTKHRASPIQYKLAISPIKPPATRPPQSAYTLFLKRITWRLIGPPRARGRTRAGMHHRVRYAASAFGMRRMPAFRAGRLSPPRFAAFEACFPGAKRYFVVQGVDLSPQIDRNVVRNR